MNTPFFIQQNDDNFAMENFNLPKKYKKEWKTRLAWLYDFPWRDEQLSILKDFQEGNWNKFVIQAVFGGGKTTMILAMIFDLLLHKKCEPDEILVCAFNVAIKNEIKKKVKYAGKVVPRTFDSIVYEICKEMDYKDLKHPNFLEKRRFLYQNIASIPPNETVQFVFLDEAQDLEKHVEYIFKKRFPNAKCMIVGDIFQSIQKEPRESLLWTLLQQESPFTYTMMNTPRVPKNILHEIQYALGNYYPEFSSTVRKWTSSNESSEAKIEWSMFKTYGDSFDKMFEFVTEHGVKDTMILVFSSAITVRGTLGDVSRARRFFIEKGIPVNSNHKLMRDDALFISTVNSSKGLERKHVFCLLTFPLELAFANFSSDILMNLLTVGMSRCKSSIHFCIPSYMERFSPVLEHYQCCPKPFISKRPAKEIVAEDKKALLHDEKYNNMCYMFEKQHSITEILRLQMFPFSTKQTLQSFVKKYKDTTLPSFSCGIRTEEEATLLGLIFETLILCFWKKSWSNSLDNLPTTGHEMFQTFSARITNLHKNWTQWKRQHVFTNCSLQQQVQGAILYSLLHLGFYNKVFCNVSDNLKTSIEIRWRQIQPFCYSSFQIADVTKIKSQEKCKMPFVQGIIDAVYLPENNDEWTEIIEIKASRARDWNENALLQAILYGFCLGKRRFRIHLVNVFSSKWNHYFVNIDKWDDMIRIMYNDLQLWNLNCYLSKNRTFHHVEKKTLDIRNTLFFEGIGREKLYVFEFTSPTKISLLYHFETKENVDYFWQKVFLLMCQNLNIEKIMIGRNLISDYIPIKSPLFRYLNKKNSPYTEKEWSIYLNGIGWYSEKEELLKDEDENNVTVYLDFQQVISMTSVQIGELCKRFNFQI